MRRARQVELRLIYMLLCAKQRGNIITIKINERTNEGTVVMYTHMGNAEWPYIRDRGKHKGLPGRTSCELLGPGG